VSQILNFQVRRDKSLLCVSPLTKAIAKLQWNPVTLVPSTTTLTSLHGELCKVCLAARCCGSSSVIGEYLDTEFVDISEEAVQSDTKYILLYFYYGGMILASMKVRLFTKRSFFFLLFIFCTFRTTAVPSTSSKCA
jgi:hypothetical protein